MTAIYPDAAATFCEGFSPDCFLFVPIGFNAGEMPR